jgi:hypothetical protein
VDIARYGMYDFPAADRLASFAFRRRCGFGGGLRRSRTVLGALLLVTILTDQLTAGDCDFQMGQNSSPIVVALWQVEVSSLQLLYLSPRKAEPARPEAGESEMILLHC